MFEIWDTIPPTNRGSKNHLFGPTSQLKGNFNGLYLWMKHDIDNPSSALTTTRGLLHLPKMSWTLVHKRFQTRPPFLPTLRKFCILLHCQASQTEISKQNSTTLCQTADGKSRKQFAAEQLGSSSQKKWGPINFNISSVFWRLRHLMANIFWMKRDTDNRARALESTKGLLHCPKIWWTLVYKRLQTRSDFFPTLTILFCHCPLHTLYAALTWRPTATRDEMALGSFAAKIWRPKRC